MFLGINTATPYLSLALVDAQGAVIADVGETVDNAHSEAIFRMLPALFAGAGRSQREVQAIAVASGPGGFTGVRTGLTVAKTMAQVLGCPVYGIPTLDALAYQFQGKGLLCPMLDGRRDLVYAGLYVSSPAGVELIAPPALFPLDAFMDWLGTAAEDAGGLLFVGEGAATHRATLQDRRKGWNVASDEAMRASAVPVAISAYRLHAMGEPTELAALAPVYLREPQAVVNWEVAQLQKGS